MPGRPPGRDSGSWRARHHRAVPPGPPRRRAAGRPTRGRHGAGRHRAGSPPEGREWGRASRRTGGGPPPAGPVESVRHPELREILVPREIAARDAVRAFLRARGVVDVEGRTLTLLACVDRLVLDRLVGGGGVPRDEISGLVAAALRDSGSDVGRGRDAPG
ncbi:TetR family transcriptional regulator [Streptomyces sp. NPDC056004]|uniref:TetR family transcriptional regulator n=1 Tax=Streptomyces sp. NPDC056004 TaxID=3345677 RepID=UPI0035DCF7F6